MAGSGGAVRQRPANRGQSPKGNGPPPVTFGRPASHFAVRRSGIAQLGVYTRQPIAKGDAVMEYHGEVLRPSVADVRELRYQAVGLGTYFFALGPERTLDATRRGGIARFINHSCSPNCEARCRTVAGQKRVVLYALRNIAAAEELTYDYNLSNPVGFEANSLSLEEVAKLENFEVMLCYCGSSNCRQYI